MIGLSLLPILPQECWDYKCGVLQLDFYMGSMGPNSGFQGVWDGDSKMAMKSKPVHSCLPWGRKLRGASGEGMDQGAVLGSCLLPHTLFSKL